MLGTQRGLGHNQTVGRTFLFGTRLAFPLLRSMTTRRTEGRSRGIDAEDAEFAEKRQSGAETRSTEKSRLDAYAKTCLVSALCVLRSPLLLLCEVSVLCVNYSCTPPYEETVPLQKNVARNDETALRRHSFVTHSLGIVQWTNNARAVVRYPSTMRIANRAAMRPANCWRPIA